MRFVTQLFAPSLLRALVGRTVAVAVGALVVLAAIALYESNDLVAKQFEDEATIVAQAAANGIEGQSTLLVRQASLLAGLPTIRELTEAKDRDALDAFLLPQKSRLLVDFMDVADLDDGERFALSHGARRVPGGEPEGNFRVFLDPSGHPFCLCVD